MRSQISATLSIAFLLASPVSAQVHLEPATPAARDAALQAVRKALADPTSIPASGLFNEVVICGPRLWDVLHVQLAAAPDLGARALMAVEGRARATRWGLTELDLASVPPSTREALKTLPSDRMVVAARGFKQGASSLAKAFGQLLSASGPSSVRLATAEEVAYYWALITYELREPIITIETSGGAYLLDMANGSRASFLELLPPARALADPSRR